MLVGSQAPLLLREKRAGGLATEFALHHNDWVLRASDQLRERTVTQLGRGYADGMLGFDTLCRRVDGAYAARSAEQLVALVRDLPSTSGSALRELLGRVAPRVFARPPESREALLAPPPRIGSGRYYLGRDATSDLYIDVATVSRRHAALQCLGDRWTIEDLGSYNGTFVNGWRVTVPTTVEPGDAVRLAELTWVFAPRL